MKNYGIGFKGIQYEKNIVNRLKKENLVPKNYKAAGTNSNKADAILKLGRNEYNVEIKSSVKECDFGQINLIYKNNSWQFSDRSDNEILKNILDKLNFIEILNKNWKFRPHKWRVENKKLTWKQAKEDQSRAKWFSIELPDNAVRKFYERKNVHYIHIKDRGMFYLGKNPANLELPKFKAKLIFVPRVKRKSSRIPSNYSFTGSIRIFSSIEKSSASLDGDLYFLKKRCRK